MSEDQEMEQLLLGREGSVALAASAAIEPRGLLLGREQNRGNTFLHSFAEKITVRGGKEAQEECAREESGSVTLQFLQILNSHFAEDRTLLNELTHVERNDRGRTVADLIGDPEEG